MALYEGVSVRDSQASVDGDVLQNHGSDGLQLGIGAEVGVNNVAIQRNGNGVLVTTGSVFSLLTGTIQDNSDTGVYVHNHATLTVAGGTIAWKRR
jgi:hypothetical protein